MQAAFLNGIVLGLVLAAMVGPVFFALIQISISKGFEAGAMLAAGVLVSDFVFIIIAWVSNEAIENNIYLKQTLGIAGGILLITFGILSLTRKNVSAANTPEVKISGVNPLSVFLKGFLLNSLNPFVLFFWLGVMSVVSLNENYTKNDVVLFFIGALTTIITVDLLKAIAANKIRDFIKPGYLLWLNRITGMALTIFGVNLLLKVF
jgi:threonine/homoserine/homoserine lactone efflux protein